ncbi:uncharacterized protein LOC114351408 [Ostrinia furnacalis]|uniref:uncharacterized protein LOC114351408 n=1 Tax=Ostrinia furnacalis TaxID=93504 RepID=UPI00103ACA30|nr:uncharacterized protein LOC114351408 [Ostrinia furnacalis]
MRLSPEHLLLIFCLSFVAADEIDIEVSSGTILKFLREMSNQTKGDTLNLPANATSIRENITDTFSCENRTYGYYADVDNECQLFHVCLPSQTPSGRNVTYKWSFICPAETVFNQEVLVCTRPRDAIPCEDSPMYYDINMEFGRVIDDKNEEDPKKETTNIQPVKVNNNKKTQIKKHPNRKQNIIVETLLNDVINEKVDKELNEMGYKDEDEMAPEEIFPIVVDPVDSEPKIEEVGDGIEMNTDEESIADEGRLAEERSMIWRGRKLERGLFRFKADV